MIFRAKLIRVWIEMYDGGAFDYDASAADLVQQYEARIAALQRLVGRQALDLEFLRGPTKCTSSEKRDCIRPHLPFGMSVARGCQLMGIARSTYYRDPAQRLDDTDSLVAITAISDEFEAYYWRRVRAALQHQGVIANHKWIKRLTREHDLQTRRRRLYGATTDSADDLPIVPDLTKSVVLSGPDQLWVADLTYVAINTGFAYVAIILHACSRKVIGYAIGQSIDARLAIAALKTAIASRKPPGLVHHSDRGSQYAAAAYRETLAANGIAGSMSRRGNPYHNAKAKSFMKTLKVEAVYPMAFET